MEDNVDTLNQLFYDRIYKILTDSNDELVIRQAFEILGNMLDSDFHVKKLADKKYLRNIFKKLDKYADDIISCHTDSSKQKMSKKNSKSKGSERDIFDVDSSCPVTEQAGYKFRLRILEKLSWLASLMAMYRD